jgi:hypothetical protein
MKKVLMGHEEQSTINTTMNQSNEVINIDTESSNTIPNEILVSKLFS